MIKLSNRKIKAVISQVRVRDASLTAGLSIAGVGGMGDHTLGVLRTIHSSMC